MKTRWWRILVVFLVDFILYITVVSIPLCLLALWLESKQVGQFAWHFKRDFVRASDTYRDVAFIATFILFWLSFGIPLWTKRRCPGGLVAGVEVRLSKPMSFMSSMIFGFFKYYALVIPLFAYFFNWGVEARAYNLETTKLVNKNS